jgi:hypothetical protein
VILMGYLIGQLGGLLPVPGGIGSVDVGLIGTLIVYGAPAAGTAAAVLAYHMILFWLPLIAGGIAFAALRRSMPRARGIRLVCARDRPAQDLSTDGVTCRRAVRGRCPARPGVL